MTLEDLPALLAAAHEQANASARYARGAAPPNVCRYCGRPCITFFYMRRIDGHARCYVTVAFQQEMYQFYWSTPGVTKTMIAQTCGVSHGAVNRWLANAKQERIS